MKPDHETRATLLLTFELTMNRMVLGVLQGAAIDVFAVWPHVVLLVPDTRLLFLDV